MSSILLAPAPISGHVLAPPSKSYTHRALVAGFLTHRPYHVHRPNEGDDCVATREGLRALGARFELRRNGWSLRPGGRPRTGRPSIDCRSSGTTLRFLTAIAARQGGRYRFRGSAELARRPMAALIEALRRGGIVFHGPARGRAIPFSAEGRLRPGEYRLPGNVSSQFLSALLFALPVLEAPSTIAIEGEIVSRPYLDATLAVLSAHRVRTVVREGAIRVPAPQSFVGRQFFVPGDASSAAYLWAAAAASGGTIRVTGLDGRWPQADLRILEILRAMGAAVRRRDRGATVEGPITSGCDVDLTAAPDLFPLVAALAATVPGSRSYLRGAPQLELKESDRRSGTERLVEQLGGATSRSPGLLEIRAGSGPGTADLPRSADHRMVMSAAVAALARRRSTRIGDAAAVGKSYPGFWTALATMGAGIEAAP